MDGRPVCFACGAAGAVGDDTCPRCGVSWLQLCACGRGARFDASACTGCGQALQPRVFDARTRRRRIAVRWALAGFAISLAGFGAVAALEPAPIEPWKLKDESRIAWERGDKAAALQLATRALDAAPRDARAWLLRAMCEHDLGLGPDVYLPSVRNAGALDPASVEIARSHVSFLLVAGQWAEALAVADRARSQHPSDARIAALHGRACLRVVPARALDAAASFAAARDLGEDDPELRILSAFAALTAWGDLPADLRPPGLSRALADVDTLLSDPAGASVPEGLEAAAARVCLALGRESAAAALARRAVTAAAATDPRSRAGLRLLAAEATLRAGDLQTAGRELTDLVADQHDAAAAAAVLAIGERAGCPTDAVRWVEEAARRGDPRGELAAALAGVALREGRWDDAERLLGAALAAAGDAPAILLLRGDLRVAQGRPDEACGDYRRAARDACRAAAIVREGLLATRPGVSATDRAAALSRAIDALTDAVGRDPTLPDDCAAMARLLLAAGRAPEARDLAARAVRAAPQRSDLQLLLAAAAGSLGTPDGWSEAARALATAQALRPGLGGAAAAQTSALLSCGDAPAAVAVASAGLQSEPDSRKLLEARARAFVAMQNWKAAAADLQRSRALGDPDDLRLVPTLVETLCRSDDPSSAAQILDACRDRLPDRVAEELDAIVAEVLPSRATGRASVVAARRRFDAGDIGGALSLTRSVLEASPGDAGATLVAVLAVLEGRDGDAAATAEARRLRAELAPSAAASFRDRIDARIALAENRAADAVEPLLRVVAASPESTADRLLLSEALFRSGRADEGLAEARRVAAVPGLAPSVRRRISARMADLALRRSGAPRDAAVAEALQVDPGNVVLVHEWVRSLVERGDLESALGWVDTALSQPDLPRPAESGLRLAGVRIALRAGQAERAQAYVAELPDDARDGADAWLARAAVRLTRGDAVGALAAFDRASALAPDDPAAVLGAAECLLRLGRDGAASRVDDWMRAHPGAAAADVGFASLLARHGRIDEAVVRARRAADARPGDETAERTAAALLATSGAVPDAISAADRFADRAAGPAGDRMRLFAGRLRVLGATDLVGALAIARRQSGPEARALEAEALAASGEDAAAERIARAEVEGARAIDRSVAARLRYVLGCTAYRTRRNDVATTHFLDCLSLDPTHAAAANNLAWIWRNDPSMRQRAAEMARRATLLAPRDPNVWDTRAACEAALGDSRAAESSWRRAIELMAAQSHHPAAARGQVSMRLAGMLARDQRLDEARAIARDVVTFARGTPAESDARRLLGAQ